MSGDGRVDNVYAIVRLDDFLGADVPTDRRITVKRVMRDAAAARKETARLNRIHGGDGILYFVRTTRLESPDRGVGDPQK